MLNKKGVDAVVATVLIIMITVAAVAIIWAVIIPFIKNSLTESTSEKVSLSIETDGGYTTWDEVQQIARVQVKRGNDKANLTGMDFNFIKGGNTRKNQTDKVPSPGTTLTYSFNLSGFGKPDKINIAPITKKGVGQVSSTATTLGNYSGRPMCTDFTYNAWTGCTRTINTSSPLGCIEGNPVLVNDSCEAPGEDGCLNGEILFGTECAVNINTMDSASYLLDKSGKTYVLTDNLSLTGNGLVIGADDVTVDMNDYSIFWEGSEMLSYVGIGIDSYDGIEITNGGVYGFELGIFFNDSERNRVANVITNDNTVFGIYLRSSSNNTLDNIVASNNDFYGLALSSSSNNTLDNIVASSNGAAGVGIVTGSTNNFLDTVTTAGNSNSGVYISSGPNNSLINVVANGNAHAGISSESNSDSKITNFIANGNGIWGLYLSSSSNVLINNVFVNGSGLDGIQMSSVSNSALTNVSSSKNSQFGIRLTSVSNNLLTKIIANNNSNSGIVLESALGNHFSNILADFNGRGIFFLSGTNNNNILEDIITNNNSGTGVDCFSYSHNNSLDNITSTYNGYGGVIMLGDNNTLNNILAIQNNKSLNNRGIVLNGDNNVLTNSTSERHYFGYILDLDSSMVSNINARDNVYTGVDLYGNSNTLTNVLINNTRDYGIYLWGDNNVLNDVTSCHNSGSDIYLYSSSDYCSGSGNVFTSVGGYTLCSGWPVLNTHYTVC